MLQQQTQSPRLAVLNRDDQIHRDDRHAGRTTSPIFSWCRAPWYEVLVDIGYFTAITMCYFLQRASKRPTAANSMPYGCSGSVWLTGAVLDGVCPKRHSEFQDFNMMFTLFLCFCILLCIETIRNRFCAAC